MRGDYIALVVILLLGITEAAVLWSSARKGRTRQEGQSQDLGKARRENGHQDSVTIVLTRRESLRLLELLEHSPRRNRKFLQAQARHRARRAQAPRT